MARRNKWLAQQQQKAKSREQVVSDATQETFVQFMIDMMILALNDPDIMGKDVFGEKRVRRVVMGVADKFNYYKKALENGDEADYYMTKIDEGLKSVLGEKDFQCFAERYDWVAKPKY